MKHFRGKTRIKFILLAIDQLANAVFGGWPDESISARAGRIATGVQPPMRWVIARKVIDWLFFWQPNHCVEAYISEVQRQQLPAAYRPDPGAENVSK